MIKTDYLIIGGGVIGCATALKLVETGARVTLIERIILGSEASSAGAGILSPLLPWHYLPAVNQLVDLSHQLYPQWVEQIEVLSEVNVDYWRCGMLVLATQDEKVKSWQSAHPQASDWVNVQDISPNLSQYLLDTGLWLPQIAQINNRQLMVGLGLALKRVGVDIHEHLAVTGWEKEGNRINRVHTTQGPIEAEVYVVCAGAWSSEVLSSLKSSASIYPVRGQMLRWQAAPELLQQMIFSEGFYLVPRRTGEIFAGSTLEEVGFDKRITPRGYQTLYEQATQLLPLLKNYPSPDHWAGLRPAHINNIPIISPHPQLGNLYLNSGHFRYGLTMTPASAELLFRLIQEQSQPIDTSPYAWP